MGFQVKEIDNFLGRGVTLPIEMSNGRWQIQTGISLIRPSIQMVLRWLVGTRFFLAEFGSKVEELLEEPNDDVLKQVAYAVIAEAIQNWEKRVELVDIEIIRPNFYSLDLKMTYRIIASKKIDSFVFPFYSQINN